MRLSFAIVFAVVALSISATPVEDSANDCPGYCFTNKDCRDCTLGVCVSINTSFPRFDNMTYLHGRDLFSAQ
ncbi:hypothetical protein BDR07DRAFT_595498 [Suillus spraguei]|nr:hypothetical protein BDR07DRAFT_595498 [Suillus spraguei]